jgi:hypothetical protein
MPQTGVNWDWKLAFMETHQRKLQVMKPCGLFIVARLICRGSGYRESELLLSEQPHLDVNALYLILLYVQ